MKTYNIGYSMKEINKARAGKRKQNARRISPFQKRGFLIPECAIVFMATLLDPKKGCHDIRSTALFRRRAVDVCASPTGEGATVGSVKLHPALRIVKH